MIWELASFYAIVEKYFFVSYGNMYFVFILYYVFYVFWDTVKELKTLVFMGIELLLTRGIID